MTRVAVADDHAVVLAGIVRVLGTASDLTVVGIARDGDEAVRLAHTERPDVFLMDLEMPGKDGIEATRAICAAIPKTRVVILTMFSDRARILAALDAGAVGYMLKDAEPAELIRAVRSAGAGESPLAPRAASALVAERRVTGPSETLTPREREIIALVGAGLPNKRIAAELGLSEKTVKTHLTSAFRRIGVFDRTQAALWAQRAGLAQHAGPWS
ncbi:MAG: response regulator transcription factor [Gaiellales bacterium]